MERKSAKKRVAKRKTQCKEGEAETAEKLPRREDLLIEAIRLVRKALKDEQTPTRNTIGNLVQLIKLHKEIMKEEPEAMDVRLIWKEVDESLFDET